MDEGVRAVLGRHMPDYEIRSVAGLGEGWDNLAYEVNDELVVRRSKEADPDRRSELTRREAELLAVVAGLSPLPVPEPVLADPEAGVIAYPKLPGDSLLHRPVNDPARPAPALGGFVAALHRAPVTAVEGLVPRQSDPPAVWLADAERDYREIVSHLPAGERHRVEDFLGRTPPPEPATAVFCHNDLGGEHILVDAESHTVTGVIDWSDAAVADPVCDLALVYRDLGPEVFEETLLHYGSDIGGDGRERAAFYARCALIEEVAYGLRTGAHRYTEVGPAHLARTFARG